MATIQEETPKVRWRSMKTRPRGKGTIWIKGTRGEYCVYFTGLIINGFSIIGNIPGWETHLGWRRTAPTRPRRA